MRQMFVAIFFMIGNLVGVSFFQLPYNLAFLGGGLIVSWFIALCFALVYSWIFAQLSILKINANVLSDYFDNVSIKKSIAIFYWFSVVFANALFLDVPCLEIGYYSLLLAFFVIFFITIINHYFSYEVVSNIEIIISCLKFLILILLPVYAYFYRPYLFDFNSFNSFESRDVLKSGVLCFWSFLGIESFLSFEKGKRLKWALLISVFATFLLYLVSCVLVVGMVSFQDIQTVKAPFFSLLINIGFDSAANYLWLLTVFVCFATLYGWVACTAKMALNFAESGLFPDYFLKKTKSNVSLYGLWFSSFLTFLIYSFIRISYLFGLIFVDNIFIFISNVCLSMFFVIFVLCSYKLICLSDSNFDKVIGILGIIFSIISLSINVFYSTFAICFFVLFYLFN